MWLSLIPPTAADPLWSDGRLWTRDVETGCVPTIEDQVTLWPDEDGHNGPMWGIKRRYMGHDGIWHVELYRMQLDPSEEVQERLLRARGHTSTWYTDRDGDPVPELERGGWQRYGGADE